MVKIEFGIKNRLNEIVFENFACKMRDLQLKVMFGLGVISERAKDAGRNQLLLTISNSDR